MRQADEKNNRAKKTPKSEGVPDTGGRLFSFHPSKEQSEILRQGYRSIKDNLDTIFEAVGRGAKLYAGSTDQPSTFYLIIRDSSRAYSSAAAVGVVHNDPGKLIAGLAYYLGAVNPEWPMPLPGSQDNLPDW